MGIPSYFVYIVKKHCNIIKRFQKSEISINNLYIYGLRFSNLKKFNIDEKEILMKKRLNTKKCYKRGKFLKKRTKKFLSKVIPIL